MTMCLRWFVELSQNRSVRKLSCNVRRQELPRICQALQECRGCGRRLSARLFSQRNDVCNAWVRRHQRFRLRTALSGVVEKREISVSEDDGDLCVYLEQNEDNIVQFLEE
jgi:hypothetical protein